MSDGYALTLPVGWTRLAVHLPEERAVAQSAESLGIPTGDGRDAVLARRRAREVARRVISECRSRDVVDLYVLGRGATSRPLMSLSVSLFAHEVPPVETGSALGNDWEVVELPCGPASRREHSRRHTAGDLELRWAEMLDGYEGSGASSGSGTELSSTNVQYALPVHGRRGATLLLVVEMVHGRDVTAGIEHADDIVRSFRWT